MAIMRKMLLKLLKARFTTDKQVVLDVPLLYETKLLEYFCYPIIVVHCGEENEIQTERLMQRE